MSCRIASPPPPVGPELAEAYRRRARATADRLRRPGRPRAMEAFDALLCGDDPEPARLVVGTVCNFLPDPLVLALGALPVRVELGVSEALRGGEGSLPRDICPAVRGILGARAGALPWGRTPDLLVLPAACDGKRKLARLLGGEVHLLQLPPAREGDRNLRYAREEVAALAGVLERLTGQRLRRRALREAIEQCNRRTALFRKIEASRRVRRLSGADVMVLVQASFLAHPETWNARAEALLSELAGEPAATVPGVPVLLAGSPLLFPDLGLLFALERAGAAVLADELCSGTERLWHPVVLDETSVSGMLRALADRMLLPCSCPCFAGGDDRVQRLLARCREAGARGVVHHTLRLCQPFELELPAVTEALRRAGLPLLAVSTELTGEEEGPLRTRLEAFVEMLDLEH